jgi:hypothetical protein
VAERQILFNPINVGRSEDRGFSQRAPPFRRLALQQMTPARTAKYDFAGARDLETLGYSLSGSNSLGTTHIGLLSLI